MGLLPLFNHNCFCNTAPLCCQFPPFILFSTQSFPFGFTSENSQNVVHHFCSTQTTIFLFFSSYYSLLLLNCVSQSSAGRGFSIRTWERTKAAIVGSLMGALSTAAQPSFILVFTARTSTNLEAERGKKHTLFSNFSDPCRVALLSSLGALN